MRAGTNARGVGRRETAAVDVCADGGESTAGVVASARTSRKWGFRHKQKVTANTEWLPTVSEQQM
tara:strand:- start:448 stop:642 length:195 start_codon:yes stop_codon:yes gene_type:complete